MSALAPVEEGLPQRAVGGDRTSEAWEAVCPTLDKAICPLLVPLRKCYHSGTKSSVLQQSADIGGKSPTENCYEDIGGGKRQTQKPTKGV